MTVIGVAQNTGKRGPTMESFRMMNAAITGVVLFLSTLAAWVAGTLSGSIWLFAGLFLLSFGAFLGGSLYYIDVRVPQKAIPMVRGRLVNRLVDGWLFVAFKGLFFLDYILVTGLDFAKRFDTIEIVPGDRTEIIAPVEVYAMIDPENPIPIIRMGGIDEAARRLQEQIVQRVRGWLCSKDEGPQDMDQARQMGDEAILAILQKLSKDDVGRIHHKIPNEAIVGFKKGRPLSEKEKELKAEFDELSEDERQDLFRGAEELLEFVEKARNGEGHFRIIALGLIVTRLGVDNIEPTAESKESVLKVNAARRDAEVQAIQAASVAAEANSYAAIKGGVKIDPVQTTLIRRGIVKKDIQVKEYDLSPNVTTAVRTLGNPLITALASRITGRKEG